MKCVLSRMWKEEDGVLSFEWVLLVTLLTFGIVSGLAGARDAIIDELGDVAQAMLALDGSYTIDYPLQLLISDDGSPPIIVGKASDSGFIDVQLYVDCARQTNEKGQP